MNTETEHANEQSARPRGITTVETALQALRLSSRPIPEGDSASHAEGDYASRPIGPTALPHSQGRARRVGPPPLNQPARVEVWEYLEDGLWSGMGEAFVPAPQDPFWRILLHILPWWGGSSERMPPIHEEYQWEMPAL